VGFAAAPIVIAACALCSGIIEFTQIFFPPRVTSVNDIAADTVGAGVGVAAWLVAGQPLTERVRHFWADFGARGWAAPLLPAYVVLLVVIHALPLDLTLSPAELYHKYREGRIRPIPFIGGRIPWLERGRRSGTDVGSAVEPIPPLELAQKAVKNLAFFLPAGVLLTGLPAPFWQRRSSWPAVLGVGLALAGGIEFMQLFVMTRTCDATDVVTGTMAVLLGWLAALAYRRARPDAVDDRERRNASLRAGLLCAWVAVLIFVSWQPFDFRFDAAFVARRLRRLSLVPFEDYFWQQYLHAFDQIAEKTVLFIPMGILLAEPCRRRGGRYAGLLVILLGAALALMLGAGKLFLPTRYTGVTDVIIETVGVWIGFVVARRAEAAARGTAQESRPTQTVRPGDGAWW
jgi:glycopeptide antibiotics resistance protein